MYNVHPLVHLSMRGWLKAHDQWEDWKEMVVARLLDIMPYSAYRTRHAKDTREIWLMYLPHAQHIAKIPETRRTKGRLWLLDVIGECEKTISFTEGNLSLQEAAERGEELTGRGPVDVSSVPVRAKVMLFQHDEEGAIKLTWDTVKAEIHAHKGMRTHTLFKCIVVNTWALNHLCQYVTAESLLRQQLDWERDHSGSVPPETLMATYAHL